MKTPGKTKADLLCDFMNSELYRNLEIDQNSEANGKKTEVTSPPNLMERTVVILELLAPKERAIKSS